MVVKRKGPGHSEFESKQPPILYLQIWDNDKLSSDDFLGTLEINLSNFPEPFESAKSCSLPGVKNANHNFRQILSNRKSLNLFQIRKIKGWYPMIGSVKKPKQSTMDLTVRI